jgi:hypothetical protein
MGCTWRGFTLIILSQASIRPFGNRSPPAHFPLFANCGILPQQWTRAGDRRWGQIRTQRPQICWRFVLLSPMPFWILPKRPDESRQWKLNRGCSSLSFSLWSNSSHYHIASGKPSDFGTKTGSVVWRKVIQSLLFEEWVARDSSCGDPFQKGYLDTIIYSGCIVVRHNVIDW